MKPIFMNCKLNKESRPIRRIFKATRTRKIKFYKPEVLQPVYLQVSEFRSCFKVNEETFRPKKLMDLNMDLLSFQQTHNEEKWPRIYKIMAQSSKPPKPVLHLPQLEVNRFNQLQTKHWSPGDKSRHSGGSSNDPEESEKPVSCTSNHMIRRIFINNNFLIGMHSHLEP